MRNIKFSLVLINIKELNYTYFHVLNQNWGTFILYGFIFIL